MKISRSMRDAIPAGVLAVLLFSGCAAAQTLQPAPGLQVEGHFTGKKGATSTDLSGLACAAPAADGAQTCVAIDDQDAHAQFAVLKGDHLTAGAEIPLGGAPAAETLGAVPVLACPDTGKFGEVDGEAAAYDAGVFYVTGSHGCGRNSGKFKESSLQFIRFKAGATPESVAAMAKTYRVLDVMRRTTEVSGYLGKDLKTADGLNIEGLAVDGDAAYFGLRAPANAKPGNAFILKASIKDLFAPGHSPTTARATAIPVPLGQNLGIRDLAMLDPGHLLILYGPALETAAPYRLAIFDLKARCLAPIGDLADIPVTDGRAKAEAVAVVAQSSDRLKLVILYDGLPDGGAQRYDVARPAACGAP